jgi:hypothetical protein
LRFQLRQLQQAHYWIHEMVVFGVVALPEEVRAQLRELLAVLADTEGRRLFVESFLVEQQLRLADAKPNRALAAGDKRPAFGCLEGLSSANYSYP